MTGPVWDDPAELAAVVATAPRPLLLALDVDGVLAPLVHHADRAALTPGVLDSLLELDATDGVAVAVVSGRSLAGLETFAFPDPLVVVGGHGGEVRGEPPPELTSDERACHERLGALAVRAAAAAGDGAWVEYKPASVVLHVRQADPVRGPRALDDLRRAASDVAAKSTPGSAVLELFARAASKGAAVDDLRRRSSPATVVYGGDDVTDEEAFEALAPGDVGIKVGDGDTRASRRLRDPDAVAEWLDELRARLDQNSAD